MKIIICFPLIWSFIYFIYNFYFIYIYIYLKEATQEPLPIQSQQWKHWKSLKYVQKLTIKTPSTYFTAFISVSIVDFELKNLSWKNWDNCVFSWILYFTEIFQFFKKLAELFKNSCSWWLTSERLTSPVHRLNVITFLWSCSAKLKYIIIWPPPIFYAQIRFNSLKKSQLTLLWQFLVPFNMKHFSRIWLSPLEFIV